MKRSPLKRKTPMKRSTKPMRKQSKKRAKLMRTVGPERKAYIAEFGKCMACGSRKRLCVHEMAKGSHREAALSEPCTWLVACWLCNTRYLEDYSIWPLARQLATKLKYDPDRFDLERFNEIRGRAATAITIEEVRQWLDWEENQERRRSK